MVALLKQDLAVAKPADRLGIAALTRHAFQGQNLTELASRILIASSELSNNAGMLMDLSVIEQLKGNLAVGLDYQHRALVRHNLFRTLKTSERKLRMLVLAAPIHMGGNTPVEMLLENGDVEIITVFIAPGLPIPENLPEHDLVMIAAPGDTGSIVSIMPGLQPKDYLREIESFLKDVTLPVINSADQIFKLERDILPKTLSGIDKVIAPKTIRCSLERLTMCVVEECGLHDGNTKMDFPFLIRPVGSHAGYGFEKITSAKALGDYLTKYCVPEYFISKLIDYKSEDGMHRKYRLVFIDGVAYPCHMAISAEWKLWYLNADMDKSEEKRLEEARWMRTFRKSAEQELGDQLNAIAERIDLDYFGIDCAIDRDGNFIVFEADNAMIAHDMDPADIYPYKKPAMQNVFKAFEKMLFDRVAAQKSEPLPTQTSDRWVRVQ